MQTICITGATIWGNRGAEAMLATTIGKLRLLSPSAKFYVFSYYPKHDRSLLRNVSDVCVLDGRPMTMLLHTLVALLFQFIKLIHRLSAERILPRDLKIIKSALAVVDVAGISFIDGRFLSLLYNIVSIWPGILLGVPVVKFSQAMGPFHNPINRLCAKHFLSHCSHVFARGKQTAGHLQTLGMINNRWSIAADLALLYRSDYTLSEENREQSLVIKSKLEAIRKTQSKRVVTIAPSSLVYQRAREKSMRYDDIMAEWILELVERGIHVVVLPGACRFGCRHARNNDLYVIDRIRKRYGAIAVEKSGGSIDWIDYDVNTLSIRQILQLSDFAVTSRFHVMIGCLSLGVPAFVIGWGHKYIEILKELGLDACNIDLSKDLATSSRHISTLLEQREIYAEKIAQGLPELVRSAESQLEYFDRHFKLNQRVP